MKKQTSITDFNWKAYNKSQTKEKPLFLQLLRELCDIIDPKLSDRLFCMCIKTYSRTSARRLVGEIELCKRGGFLKNMKKVPHFNSVLANLNLPTFTPILHDLIKLSSLPLQSIERKFAVDSTGFGLKILEERWSIAREMHSKHHLYKKAHICYGVLSNIVTAVAITEGTVGDAPLLPELIDATSKNFKLDQVMADKAYSSRKNLKAISEHDALPLIPFKSNATGKAKGQTIIWKKMYWWFQNNRTKFLELYHLRSNAEAGMMMIKTRFGDTVMTRSETAITNELLCKILCHNICVLIQETFLMGIETDFFSLHKRMI